MMIRDKLGDQVLESDFDRIVVGHGPVFETDGRHILENAYDFLRS